MPISDSVIKGTKLRHDKDQWRSQSGRVITKAVMMTWRVTGANRAKSQEERGGPRQGTNTSVGGLEGREGME